MDTAQNNIAKLPQTFPAGSITVEAQSRHSFASVQVSHLDLIESHKHTLQSDNAYRLDFCMTHRLASRMRFECWRPDQFQRPGSIFIVPPGEPLTVWNALGRESIVVCDLFTEAIAAEIYDEDDIFSRLLDECLNLSNSTLETLMFKLAHEICHPGFASDVMIQSLAMQMVVELHRHYHKKASSISDANTNTDRSLAAWRLRRIEERSRSAPLPSLVELAELCDLSVRQLSRSFKACRGMTIGQYIADQRIEQAKCSLASGSSVKVVALDMGFSSSAAFGYAFRRRTGITPGNYRRLTNAER